MIPLPSLIVILVQIDTICMDVCICMYGYMWEGVYPHPIGFNAADQTTILDIGNWLMLVIQFPILLMNDLIVSYRILTSCLALFTPIYIHIG